MSPTSSSSGRPELDFSQLRVTDGARTPSAMPDLHGTSDRLVDAAARAVKSNTESNGDEATDKATAHLRSGTTRAGRSASSRLHQQARQRAAQANRAGGGTRTFGSLGGQLRASRLPGTRETAGEAGHAAADLMSHLRPRILGSQVQSMATRVVNVVADQGRRAIAAIVAALAGSSASTFAAAAAAVVAVVAVVAAFLPIIDWLDQQDRVAYQQCAGAPGTVKEPAEAQQWVNEAASASGLPASYLAAIMSIESNFNPTAHADDSNGGTWGLFQLNSQIWASVYPSGDEHGTGGIPVGITDPDTHAKYGGIYFKQRMATVKQLQTSHKGAAFAALPPLDALTIAHNAGEGSLMQYPNIPQSTKDYLTKLHGLLGTGAGDVCTTGGASGPGDLSANGPCPADVPGTVSCNVAIGFEVAQMKANTRAWHEKCLGLVTTAYGGVWGGIYDAATAARQLEAEGEMHQTTDYASIPRGVVLWWTGGSHGHGHVAMSEGGGEALSSDVPVLDGRIGTEPIDWFEKHWGQHFEGWSAPVR